MDMAVIFLTDAYSEEPAKTSTGAGKVFDGSAICDAHGGGARRLSSETTRISGLNSKKSASASPA